MKILITHNDYGRRSGEEAVVDKMGEMMRSHGHEICYYRQSTASYQKGMRSKIKVFLAGVYSFSGIKGMKKALKNEHPDVVNIHNLYPFISPAALFACKSAGVPIIMTVHNYRLVCPTGLFMRQGKTCEHCLRAKSEWGCVRYNCERSLFKSLGYALRGYIARKTGAYYKNVDRFVCLTSFQKNKLIEAGFREEKITVIPNSVPLPQPYKGSAGRYIAYAGRLSEEKGWDLLREIARRNPTLPIKVAGFIPTGTEIAQMPDNIEFTGYLEQEQLSEFYQEARFFVIPSRCYEGFPMVAQEAMAMGKPVIAPDHGGFAEIIGKGPQASGLLFRPGDVNDLEAVIRELWDDEKRIREMGKRCMEKAWTSYSSEMIYRQWEHLILELLT